MMRKLTALFLPILLGVTVGAMEAFAQDPSRPTISSFSANRATVGPGEQLVFSWNVSGADSITLRGPGLELTTDIASGSQSITVPASAGSQVYTSDVLVREGSLWAFHSLGFDLGQSWHEPDFEEDEGWRQGLGELGYGDGDESTIIGERGLLSAYFRKKFFVRGADATLRLDSSIKRDDGIVLYLNGQEILRNNMPQGEIRADTFADRLMPTPEELFFEEFPLPLATGLLREGENMLAARVHQIRPDSSDLSFDINLRYSGEVLPRETYTLTATNEAGTATAEFSVRVANRSGADSDNDALPDQWETAFFGSLVNGADEDTDGDGFPNIGEFAAGTHPFNSGDFPAIPGTLRIAQGKNETRLESSPLFGAQVSVQYSVDLSSWIDLGILTENEAGAVFVDSDRTRAGRERGYYRAFWRQP